MNTKKIYYENNFATECEATIMEINSDGIILDQTVAFPEGGGQIGDKGIVSKENNICAEFIDTRKIEGRTLFLKDFPLINVESKVVHYISEENLQLFNVGDKVKIKIDVERRAKATLHHSGLHVALMVYDNLKKDILKSIVGCKITDKYGRVDIRTEEKISKEEMDYIAKETKRLICENLPVEQFPYEGEQEALYWKCGNYIMPCGGTHVTSTKDLGQIEVKRKNIGKGVDRLIITLIGNEDFIQKFN
ncbi:MAG: alanine--tRNA ligase-related protein [Fusobacteriaceae bacterium]